MSDDDFYNTPKMICQGKIIQPCALGVGDRNSTNTHQRSTKPFASDFSPERTIPRHLEPKSFNEDKTSDSKLTIPDPNELLVLREKCAEQEAITRRCIKAREEQITNNFEEKQELLRQIAALKKKNEMAASVGQLEIVGQVEQPRLQEKKLSQNLDINQEGPVIQ